MRLTTANTARQYGLILGVCSLLLLGGAGLFQAMFSPPAQAASTEGRPSANITNSDSALPQQQNRECDGTETGLCRDGTCTHADVETLACVFNGGVEEWYGPAGPPPTLPPPVEGEPAPPVEVIVGTPTPVPPANLIDNGNFESGFYGVPQLGFEAYDSGAVPNGWNWYKSQTYGKYTIFDNQGYGIDCPGDDTTPVVDTGDGFFGPVPGVTARSSNISALGLHMQSTDEQDARLGIYQVVNVTPGLTYRYAMSGTITVQSGASTLQPDDPFAPEEAQNHTVELYFDQTGNTDWKAIPHKRWTTVPWIEQKLEFRVSEDDSDIPDVENYVEYFTAESNQVTIFITLWRKWANWRTGIATIDCVFLEPFDPSQIPEPIDENVVVVGTLAEGRSSSAAQPAAARQPGDTTLPVTGNEPPAIEPVEISPKPQPQVETQAEAETAANSQVSEAANLAETVAEKANPAVDRPAQSAASGNSADESAAAAETAEVAAVPAQSDSPYTIWFILGAVAGSAGLVGLGAWRLLRRQ